MKKSFLFNIGLCAFLAGLFTWYFLYEKKIRPEQEKNSEQEKQLITFDSKDIQEITLEKLDSSTRSKTPKYSVISLKHLGENWTLVAPIQDATDSSPTTAMVTALTTTKQERVVDEKPKDLETYGLKDPDIKIRVKKDSTSPAQEIWIGKDTPVGYSLYVKLAGKDPVYKVSKSLRTTFDKKE
jgi:hypothetical protein